jgi:hypothetical protein
MLGSVEGVRRKRKCSGSGLTRWSVASPNMECRKSFDPKVPVDWTGLAVRSTTLDTDAPVTMGATQRPFGACTRTWSPTCKNTSLKPIATSVSSQKLEWAVKSSRVCSYIIISANSSCTTREVTDSSSQKSERFVLILLLSTRTMLSAEMNALLECTPD